MSVGATVGGCGKTINSASWRIWLRWRVCSVKDLLVFVQFLLIDRRYGGSGFSVALNTVVVRQLGQVSVWCAVFLFSTVYLGGRSSHPVRQLRLKRHWWRRMSLFVVPLTMTKLPSFSHYREESIVIAGLRKPLHFNAFDNRLWIQS